MQIEILFEDQDIAIINKPAGVVVNDADTNHEESIQEWWMSRPEAAEQASPRNESWKEMIPADYPTEYGSPESIFEERGGIVHRLDKETSGVMILAKNPGSLLNLLSQFRKREVQKRYQCLVHGKFQVTKDVIHLPLSRSKENRLRYAVLPDGREATTEYEVVQFFPRFNVSKGVEFIHATFPDESALPKPLNRKLQNTYQGFSLVNCWPKTGRTHQIRVHMSHLKHPIVSDDIYLGNKRSQLDRLWCERLFLHAAELKLHHPRTQKELLFTLDLPQDLSQALSFLDVE